MSKVHIIRKSYPTGTSYIHSVHSSRVKAENALKAEMQEDVGCGFIYTSVLRQPYAAHSGCVTFYDASYEGKAQFSLWIESWEENDGQAL